MFGDETSHDEVEVRRFAGVIEAAGAVGFVAAAAEDQKIGGPPAALCFLQKAATIVRADRALESVKNEQTRCAWLRIEPVEIEEIAVGRVPALRRAWVVAGSGERTFPRALRCALPESTTRGG